MKDFLIQLSTSLGSVSLVGFLFWTWITNRFKYMEEMHQDNKVRIRELENLNHQLLSKQDHYHIRKEDSERIEKQISEVKTDIKKMPEQIVNLLKPFLNKQ
ncbi:MAG TPA: hypothetical protein PKY29_04410 [Ferruginibacter sp.]|nr:hypothetical protein [Ferruginibacter sp.]HRQ20531.1 hypothetical protein [Ferruginibacter sp.]